MVVRDVDGGWPWRERWRTFGTATVRESGIGGWWGL